ncbi:uncharacterized protein RHIMIDRAFT_63892 [Rhizopus microsporus ATCC 52813]|uniref:Secreted protein n=1 Tax=Rhizopus microsporus ATCC 52813 TaxID=1340429 RepID=A0A2G4T6F0_RHIZD|nr:uncharacterized protein RHIMIDRAFT_63892 [Rhizopus microsporus ATCC 52813]PHZ16595.1 hypothetical protein RHIMIDRAFT_63892 [Rhizopus microsporus ATCC 52813]
MLLLLPMMLKVFLLLAHLIFLGKATSALSAELSGCYKNVLNDFFKQNTIKKGKHLVHSKINQYLYPLPMMSHNKAFQFAVSN